jgi:hypothetical protein
MTSNCTGCILVTAITLIITHTNYGQPPSVRSTEYDTLSIHGMVPDTQSRFAAVFRIHPGGSVYYQAVNSVQLLATAGDVWA